MPDGARELESARDLLAGSRRVVVLSGAGISTDSGIPDFRGPDGVWTRDPEAERLATIDVYLAERSVRERAWRRRMDHPAWTAEPNAGHRALRGLDLQGRMHLLVTQNIDGLHLAAGHDPDDVVQVHGSLPESHCVRCDWSGPTRDVFDRVRSGELDPACPDCGGVIKPRVVFFGEALVEADIARALDAAGEADMLLAVGTTLAVYPVAHMVPIAVDRGAPVVIVNGSETEMDDMATVVLRGSLSELLPALVAGLPAILG
ncbi:MAG TPA: Sir2 family NAD-dependent protein deacetylase [Microthrixaceae bacterium]|nr:NAD-dependent deacetylase [Microthrixaceae bacterium]MCO5305009.1 Sir2 family NAD-dependent protein deacetylase [Microthrixaceae bacterium]HPG13621.1 Sir2 family NAD-dependent protein deacetylase [Microthrixaceae bacterium]